MSNDNKTRLSSDRTPDKSGQKSKKSKGYKEDGSTSLDLTNGDVEVLTNFENPTTVDLSSSITYLIPDYQTNQITKEAKENTEQEGCSDDMVLTNIENNVSSAMDFSSSVINSSSGLQQQIYTMQQKINELQQNIEVHLETKRVLRRRIREALLCSSCRRKKKRVAIDPCGHLLCGDCVSSFYPFDPYCPVCGRFVLQVLLIEDL